VKEDGQHQKKKKKRRKRQMLDETEEKDFLSGSCKRPVATLNINTRMKIKQTSERELITEFK